jgi:hypothetical protein
LGASVDVTDALSVEADSTVEKVQGAERSTKPDLDGDLRGGGFRSHNPI